MKYFSGAKTKSMKSYIYLTVDQNPDNVLHTGTNDLKNMDAAEERAM